MHIRSNLKGTKGWLYMRERSIRFRYMITETAKRRATILTFWEKHDLEATEEAYLLHRTVLCNTILKFKPLRMKVLKIFLFLEIIGKLISGEKNIFFSIYIHI